MTIEWTSGHLTATEKKAVKAILAAKLTSGKVGRKEYYLEQIGNDYSLKVLENESNDYGVMFQRKGFATFKIKA